MKALEETLDRSTQGICVIGELTNPGEVHVVKQFVQRLGWITIADPLSQLRITQDISTLLCYGDLVLLKDIPEAHRPDTILHIGGRFVSKRISQLLATQHGPQIIQIVSTDDFSNPYVGVRERYVTDLQALAGLNTRQPQRQRKEFASFFHQRNEAVAAILEDACALVGADAIDEPRLLRLLAGAVPSEHVLTVGNSMPIRDFDMFAAPRPLMPWVVANRGASGIDGVVATGIGAALASKHDGTIIVGDLSMLHDLNSLGLLKNCAQSIVVVVINNDGGGIFSLLPVAASECFEKAFATPHGREFSNIAAGFSMRYAKPTNLAECMGVYRDAINHRGATLLEVVTNREANAALHRELHMRISKALC
jgi:2-succinyl-5-enolpyruvyl-6-hydroxy-3-cyclohexene-1-carboxylate synthase